MHWIDDDTARYVKIREAKEFGPTYTGVVKLITPLVFVSASQILVRSFAPFFICSKFPCITISTSIASTTSGTAAHVAEVLMRTGSKTNSFSCCQQVTNNENKSTKDESTFREFASSREVNARIPKFEEFVNERREIML
jgi:hypothetical protein